MLATGRTHNYGHRIYEYSIGAIVVKMKGTNASVGLQFFQIELPASTKSYLAFWRTNKYPSGASAFAYSTTIKEDRVCHINKTTSNLGETDEKLLLFKRKRSSTALCDGTVMRALRACVRHG